MVEALIIAGGKGVRTNQDIPKQFINIDNIPILVYTLNAFQQHPEVDEILVVCIDGWHEILWAYARQFGISKLKQVIPGGSTGQESIRNGIMELKKHHDGEDIVLIHDGIRPNVSQEIISGCIAQCRLSGSAITVIPCAEAMLLRQDEGGSSKEVVDRECLARTQTPQAFPLKKLLWAHEEAEKRGITNSVATCTLMIELGEEVCFCAGSEKNVKITTVEDIEIFKALLYSRKEPWLK
nr:IspD/TarI family cytidylyltransferase [uncultured Schaedlerella sp.]